MARAAQLTFVLALALAALGALGGTPPGAITRAAETATLVAVGNIGDCTSDADEATVELVPPGATVAALGDLAYPNGRAEDFAQCFDSSWGAIRSRIRPVPGNHDYATGDASAYFDYFGQNAGDPGAGYYSYELGAWHVVALNSVCDHVECDDRSDQIDWLRRDLSSTTSNCVIAYWHHPRFSSGTVGSNPAMATAWRILQEAGAEIVLSGHSHHYERFAPQDHRGQGAPEGIRQFVIGTGGTALHQVGTPLLNSERVVEGQHGVLRLELEDHSFTWTFVSIDGGVALDEGRASCDSAPLALGRFFRSMAPALLGVPVVLLIIAAFVLRSSQVRVR